MTLQLCQSTQLSVTSVYYEAYFDNNIRRTQKKKKPPPMKPTQPRKDRPMLSKATSEDDTSPRVDEPTEMLFRLSESELFDTFTNIILLRIFPL
jgi:hypothetical protein